jgi:tRNA pseudouridine38-40 synthase
MVRIIAGSLGMVGAGRREADWLAAALAARSRAAAGPTAPPEGLVLVSTQLEMDHDTALWQNSPNSSER